LGREKIRRTRILISKVGINNNSPRILKRYFHSTNPNRVSYDYITEMLNIIKLEDIQFLISQGVIHIQMQDFSDPSVTKAVNYLSKYTLAYDDKTYAEFWKFDTSILEGNRI
jgi:beta-lactam-binding protein with PASTA domain